VNSGSGLTGLYMIVRIIRALSLEHSVDNPHELVGHMRQGDQMVFAPSALAVINRPEHRIAAAGGQRGMPDRPAQVRRAAAHTDRDGGAAGDGHDTGPPSQVR
jgi:hypothetical protein